MMELRFELVHDPRHFVLKMDETGEKPVQKYPGILRKHFSDICAGGQGLLPCKQDDDVGII